MKIKLLIPFFIIIFMVVLIVVVCLSTNKHNLTQINYLLGSNSENIVLNKFNDDEVPVVELTNPKTNNISPTLRILSDEENIATTLKYIMRPKTNNISQYTWESFHYKYINKFAKAVKWPSLREVFVPSGSLEVRIWINQVWGGNQVLRICRHNDKWMGFYTNEMYNEIKFINDEGEREMENNDTKTINHSFLPVLILTPQTNWENIWNKVEALGILTLPDSSMLPSGVFVDMTEGTVYVIEINDGVQYWTYMYNKPQNKEWPEAKKFIQIIETLYNELKQSLPKQEMPWH